MWPRLLKALFYALGLNVDCNATISSAGPEKMKSPQNHLASPSSSVLTSGAVVHYVSTTGMDSPSCGPQSSPCKTIQHAADAFLLDRRRYFDPERMRAIIEAREMAPTPLMQQVRIARTHTARDARALDLRAGLAHSRPHPMHVHARRRRPFSHRPLATNRARARMRPNRRRARAATARTASSTMGRTTRAAIP